MKKIVLLIIGIILFTNILQSQTFEVNGINYNVTSSVEPYTVEVTEKDPKYLGDIVIPSEVTYNGVTYTVTGIGSYAFNDCSNLTAVTIPNSVSGIWYQAFGNCSSLMSVIIPNSVTTISDRAFYGCASLTSVTIPNSVSNIIQYTFASCTNLTSVNIPNSVTTIGGWAFYGCTNLTSVNIPNSVTSIGYGAFWNCSSLTSLVLPISLEVITNTAFYDCINLDSIISYSTTPPLAETNTFYGVPKTIPVYVPDESIDEYQATFSWEDFTNYNPLSSIEGDQITVADVSAGFGSTCEVAITTGELTAQDSIISYQFDIDFDHTALEYVDYIKTSTISASGTVNINSSTTGSLSVSCMSSDTLKGLGNLLILRFNPLKADTTAVSISNAYFNETQILNLTNGSVSVGDVIPPSAAITYDDNNNRFADTLTLTAAFSESMLADSTIYLNFTGAVSASDLVMTRVNDTVYTYEYSIPKTNGVVTVSLSNGVDLSGNEVTTTPTAGTTFEIIEFHLGDVSDNGTIMAYDAALTLQHSVGLDPLPAVDPLPWEPWRDSTANVDDIGGITANDAGMILQYSTGNITDFNGSKKKILTSTDVSIELIDNQIVFFSHGNLIGLNISVEDKHQLLGHPMIVAKEFMQALNIDESKYKIGLCTASPFLDGDVLLKIPYIGDGQVILNLNINGYKKSLMVNLAVIVKETMFKNINVYPNPAKDQLVVEFNNELVDGCFLTIVNPLGAVVYDQNVEESLIEIDLTNIESNGLHFLQILNNDGGYRDVRKVVLE